MKILHWLEGSVKWYGTAGEKKVVGRRELLSQVYEDTKRSLSREYDTCGSMYVSTLCHAC
jgi:hypothetical protein